MSIFRHAKVRWHVLLGNRPCQIQSISRLQLQLYSCKSSLWDSGLLVRKDQAAIATALSLSENWKSYDLGTQIHSCVIKLGFGDDIFSQNNLIKMYLKSGVLCNGFKVFEGMAEKNLVTWTLMISGVIQNGECRLGLEIYLDMLRNGLTPNEFSLGSVMKVCANLEEYECGLSIHSFALKTGLVHNPFVGSSILNMYAKSGDIRSAELAFECMNNLDVGCWNALIGGYVQCGCGFEALKILSVLPCMGIKMDHLTFINALKGCSVVRDLSFGKQIHVWIIQSEVQYGTSVVNALMDMYFKNGDTDSAFKVFSGMNRKDVISWNIAFGGFSPDGSAREFADLYHDFMLTGLKPNHITFSILFRKCGDLLDLNLGLQLYCIALHFGFFDEVKVTSSLINMFCRCGRMDMACIVFDSITLRNIITWNEFICGCITNCCYREGIKTFSNLRALGIRADQSTFLSTLEACCNSRNQEMGRQIHGDILKSGFAADGFVCSSVIKCYTTLGLLDDSYEFFRGAERLDLASWGTMISTLVNQGHNSEAIRFLRCLLEAGEKPDEFILASILNSFADVAAYCQTKSVHPLVIKTGYDMHVFVASAVIDAYAKCSDIENARVGFNQSFRSNDVVIYNTMIMAYAHHGLIWEAMDIFKEMRLTNLQPSQATFISVISACSHKGLVDLGCFLFESMCSDYGMEPPPEIYGCLVDLLSRNGYLEDAKHIIEVMPFPPWPAIWRSLLSGCRIHGNRKLGELAYENLLQLVPLSDAAHVLLAKVFSEGGEWEDAAALRRKMTERGISKSLGYCWIAT